MVVVCSEGVSYFFFFIESEFMKCWHCKTDLIWGGDEDYEDEDYSMVTNLTCPKCISFILVYYLKEFNT